MLWLYIETSIVSYYTSRPNRDVIIAARQEITRDFWSQLWRDFEVYISALVIQEISQGDAEAARKRSEAISEIPVLEISEKARELAEALLTKGAIPIDSEEDALHIAVAGVNEVDFLCTWNFKHIHNVFTKSKIEKIMKEMSIIPPMICSPNEMLGE